MTKRNCHAQLEPRYEEQDEDAHPRTDPAGLVARARGGTPPPFERQKLRVETLMTARRCRSNARRIAKSVLRTPSRAGGVGEYIRHGTRYGTRKPPAAAGAVEGRHDRQRRHALTRAAAERTEKPPRLQGLLSRWRGRDPGVAALPNSFAGHLGSGLACLCDARSWRRS